jgi:hypothetical protein
MILNRRKIKHGTQEEIGYELGLIVPKNKSHLFNKVRTGKKPSSGWGTQVGKKQYSINKFFRTNNINLKEKYFIIKKIKSIKQFIEQHLMNGDDIIACFNNKILFGRGNWGHTTLIQTINNEEITLIDPEQDVPNRRKVKLKNLIKAILHHGVKNRGGFWIILK